MGFRRIFSYGIASFLFFYPVDCAIPTIPDLDEAISDSRVRAGKQKEGERVYFTDWQPKFSADRSLADMILKYSISHPKLLEIQSSFPDLKLEFLVTELESRHFALPLEDSKKGEFAALSEEIINFIKDYLGIGRSYRIAAGLPDAPPLDGMYVVARLGQETRGKGAYIEKPEEREPEKIYVVSRIALGPFISYPSHNSYIDTLRMRFFIRDRNRDLREQLENELRGADYAVVAADWSSENPMLNIYKYAESNIFVQLVMLARKTTLNEIIEHLHSRPELFDSNDGSEEVNSIVTGWVNAQTIIVNLISDNMVTAYLNSYSQLHNLDNFVLERRLELPPKMSSYAYYEINGLVKKAGDSEFFREYLSGDEELMNILRQIVSLSISQNPQQQEQQPSAGP